MTLPESLKPYFPSYELSDLDRYTNRHLIITALLNYGDAEAVRWIFTAYELPEIFEVIRTPSRGNWTRKSLNYWRVIFDLEVDELEASRALADLAPRPDIYSSIFD